MTHSMPLTSVRRPGEGPADGTTGATECDDSDELRRTRPPRDAIFEVLRASRRREVLRHLDSHGGEATIGALAEYVASKENDVDRTAVTASQRKRVYVGLYQVHLPKLAEYGAVEWHKDRGFVKLVDASRWFLAYLAFDPAGDESASPDSQGPLAAIRRRFGHVLGR